MICFLPGRLPVGLDTCPKLTSSSGSEGQTLEVDHTAGSPECGFFIAVCLPPLLLSLSHDSVSFCYRPSGQGAGAFPGIIARGVWIGEEVPTG